MIRAGSGTGKGEAAHAACLAAEAAVASLSPGFAFVFASGFDEGELDEVLDAVKGPLGNAPFVGCSGGGVVGTGEEVEGEPSVSVVALETDPDAFRVEPVVEHLSGDGARDATGLAAACAGKLHGPADRSALVLLPDPFRFDGRPFLSVLSHRLPKLPVVGGLAASSLREKAPVFTHAGRREHGVAGAVFSGPRLRATVAVAQGCRPITPSGKVTRAERNLVYELDGEPAIHRLKLAVEAAQASGGALFCGLGVEPFLSPVASEDYLARNILGVDPKSGAVAVAEIVPPGSTVCFLVRDARAAREDLEARVLELKAAFSRKAPAFALYFDCLGRGTGLYGEAGVDSGIIRRHLGPLPLGGFFGNGELAPFLGTNLVHNYTGVLVLVGES